MIRITVPLVPPSVNHYAKHTRSGRHYVTSEAKSFKEAVAIFAGGQTLTASRYSVSISVYLGKGQRGDIDNFLKCVLDGMVEARVIHSDSAVTRLTVEKFRDEKNPRTEITVYPL